MIDIDVQSLRWFLLLIFTEFTTSYSVLYFYINVFLYIVKSVHIYYSTFPFARSYILLIGLLIEDEKHQSHHYQQQPQEQQSQQPAISETPSIMKRSPTIQSSAASVGTQSPASPRKNGTQVDQDKKEENDGYHLTIPKVIAVSSSSETLTGNNAQMFN